MDDKITNLLLNKGLYESEAVCPVKEDLVLVEKFFKRDSNKRIRMFCPGCKDSSVFTLVDSDYKRLAASLGSLNSWSGQQQGVTYEIADVVNKMETYMNKVYTLTFLCEMDHYEAVFCLLFSGCKITKIGQYPSVADLGKPTFGRFKRYLKNDYENLYRAYGLYSHGIGIGSFVYL